MSQRCKVTVVAYDADWRCAFAELCDVVSRTLGDLTLRIEHVGSTSVPGLAAKPIIDLDVVIATWRDLEPAITQLGTLGYRHQGNLGIAEREAFARAGIDVPRDGSGRHWLQHHLYVCAEGSFELTRHVVFRDYLRGDHKAAADYAVLKRGLAQQFADDIDAYCNGKTQFITAVLAKAGLTPRERGL